VQQTAPAAAPTLAAEPAATEVAAIQNTQPAPIARPPAAPRSIPVAPPAAQPEPEKKKGFFGRLKDIFK
jgi:hypothetical protein